MSEVSGGTTAPEPVAEPRVQDIMRRQVPTLAPEDTVAFAAKSMVEAGLPGLPVVERDRIVGLVGESDLLVRYAEISPPGFTAFFDWIIQTDTGLPYGKEVRRMAATTVRQLMSSPVYSIRDTATLSQIATVMIERAINPVPVVDANGDLVGIVTRADLVRLIARLESLDVVDNTR